MSITVGDLKRHLEAFGDEMEIFFGCEELEFYRLKQRGENLVQLEFNQTVYADSDGQVIVDMHTNGEAVSSIGEKAFVHGGYRIEVRLEVEEGQTFAKAHCPICDVPEDSCDNGFGADHAANITLGKLKTHMNLVHGISID